MSQLGAFMLWALKIGGGLYCELLTAALKRRWTVFDVNLK